MKYTTCGFALDELWFVQSATARVLLAAAKGVLDLNLLASEELVNRGLDPDGNYVGVSRAEAAFIQRAVKVQDNLRRAGKK